MSHPFALSLFGNYVYWTDWSSNAVVRVSENFSSAPDRRGNRDNFLMT